MNIVFVCGSIEKGRDGVGDYTRLLAAKLLSMGHQCSILALMDKFVECEIYGFVTEEEVEIDFLRLPFKNGHLNNATVAKKWVDDKNPDCISLQFVPFAYNIKGLPFGIAESIKKIICGRKLHIMFHEMWMGISKISPFKHKIIGFFQIRIAKKIIELNKPVYITTTNKLYSLVLERESIKSDIIPLFSNINKNTYNRKYYISKLEEFNISIDERSKWIFIGIFGSLYPEINIQAEIEFHLEKLDSKNLNLAFISIGRIGVYGLKEFARLKTLFGERVKFILVGEVSEKEASLITQTLDIAVSCTPAQHIAKSGAFAFLKLHEIPTRLISKEILPEYEMETVEWYKYFVNRPQYDWNVSTVAKAFSQQLMEKISGVND